MGFYLAGPKFGKADDLIERFDAEVIDREEAYKAFDEGFGIVVVRWFPTHEAAGFAYDKQELERFLADDVHVLVLKMDRGVAERVAGWSK